MQNDAMKHPFLQKIMLELEILKQARSTVFLVATLMGVGKLTKQIFNLHQMPKKIELEITTLIFLKLEII